MISRVLQDRSHSFGWSGHLKKSRELRLAARSTMIDHHVLSDASRDCGATSSSISANAKSIPAVIPAEVQTHPSLMKILSGLTTTFGNSACNRGAYRQCVVARLPSRSPAAASSNAPVQILATRRE